MKKILIVTKNWLGDILFQLPAIEAIRKEYPSAEIVCMSPKRCVEILKAHPAVDRVLIFDEKKEHRSFASKVGFVAQIKKEKFDRAYLFHRSKTRALITALAGVKERVGYVSGRRRKYLTIAVPEPVVEKTHHADYFLPLVAASGISTSRKGIYHFYFSDKARQSMDVLMQKYEIEPNKYVCFHLGANWLPKRWPPNHFAELAEKIEKRFGLKIVLTGGSDDVELAEKVLEETEANDVVSLVDQTSLEELAALYSQAAWVVSGDSGPMHIASGVGAKVIALFGPTHPELTGPRGTGESIVLHKVPEGYHAPWYKSEMPRGGWLSLIQPEEVLQSIETGQGISSCLPPAAPENRSSAPRILFVSLSNIGDVILTTPTMMALLKYFPGAKLTVVAGPRAKGLLENSRLIDRLVVYNKRATFPEQIKFVNELRKEKYDWVIDLRNTAIPYLVSTKKRSPLIKKFKQVSMRERHLEVLSMMGLPTDVDESFDFYQDADNFSVDRKLEEVGISDKKDWILIAPVAASGLKTWKLDRFRNVIKSLLRTTAHSVLLVGDAKERENANDLCEMNRERVFNLAGKTTLPELAALVKRCSLLIANDSAVMHLGYELDRPVVAIFGPTHPEKYGHKGPNFRIVKADVVCAPCENPRCMFQRQYCFEDLLPEQVIEACEELIDEATPAITPTA